MKTAEPAVFFFLFLLVVSSAVASAEPGASCSSCSVTNSIPFWVWFAAAIGFVIIVWLLKNRINF